MSPVPNVLVLLLIASSSIGCEPSHTPAIDFNQFYAKLEQHSRFGIKSYLEAPDPDILLNTESRQSKPCKLFNATHASAQLFEGWSERALMRHVNTSFMFADITEAIEGAAITKRTGLRRLLGAQHELLFESTATLNMPAFFKKRIEFPGVLECDLLEDKFQHMNMQIYMNYENFTGTLTSELDQLFCTIKGSATFVMMNSTNINTVLANQEKLSKKILKKVETFRAELKAADCVYVPAGLSYAVRSEFAWLYQVSWPRLERTVTEEECFDRDNRKQPSKIHSHSFTFDSEEDKFYEKISHVIHFAGYLEANEERQLTRLEFVREDEKRVKFKCDQNCKNILFKVFELMDSNSDNLLDQSDLDQFDEEQLERLNEEIKSTTKMLGDKEKSGVEDMRNMLTQLKSLAAQADMGSDIARMIEEKTRDWYDTLTFDQKQRLQQDGLRDIVDELLTINGGSVEKAKPRAETARKSKKPRRKQPVEAKPADSEDVEIVAEEDEESVEEVVEEVQVKAEKRAEKKAKAKGPSIDLSGENPLNLSDEQMARIMEIIEAEDAKEAAAKQEL